MNPECPRCDATTTRRVERSQSIWQSLKALFGYYPWECLACQKRFFDNNRFMR
jgi:ribosomal protein L37AE/L43A